MKKTLKFATIIAAVVLASVQARAMTVLWSASGAVITLQGGTTADATGNLVELGDLIGTTANAQANQNNIVVASANFGIWQSGHIGDGAEDGLFTENSSAAGATFFGKQAYLLAFSNPSAPLSGQWGVYTNPSWIFPASDSANPLTMDISDSGTTEVVGSFSAGTVTTPTDLAGADAYQLHAVPEPSSIVLVALGLLGGLGVIRRRK